VTRKSKAYFVNAIYKVPGTLKKKKRSKTKVASSAAASMKSAPTATAGRKRAATATIVPATAAKKPTYKANPAATAALAAVLESAQDNQNGVPDAKVLAKAMVFGYSKTFIDAKIAEQEELNVKPAAR
jgi:cytoskeletal protein RodZ